MADNVEGNILCKGSSMLPLLRHFDYADIEPYNGRPVRKGDAVLFFSSGGKHKVIHRVVSVGIDGIKTRGDNNSKQDRFTLKPEEILGRVTYIYRGGRKIRMHGCLTSRLIMLVYRLVQRFGLIASFIFSPAYRWLSKRIYLTSLIPVSMRPRVISFNGPEDDGSLIMMGRLVIARRPAGKDEWNIRRPFRFFVKEDAE